MALGRRHDKTGRSTGVVANSRLRQAMRPPVDQPWVWLTRDLLASYAWRSMSANARRLVERVMLEHMAHGGAENGALPVTYDDLSSWGIRLNSVAPSIAEAVALGLIEHHPGRAAHIAGKGHAQLFRLSWLPTCEGEPALTRWQAFASLEDAQATAKAARAQGTDGRHNARRRAGRGADLVCSAPGPSAVVSEPRHSKI